ncbi:rhodanese-like domain-containing protein [Pedobacter sp. HDW13]|uniref:rhodanese-like domain-containing protein n=1 Tax=Pedobacter sp. HDW13 TaxID=2714940 RepID=UPI0014076913|nr:rhodanese-like domain-containing protein [Pedobacter sp. HDW13]QIL38837.1 rhodanese-like domain-containing protein [Pedobacter sp. HDW13]
MKTKIITIMLFSIAYLCNAQTTPLVKRKANVDFDAYEKLIPEVKAHRKSRLVDLPAFLKMAAEKGTIILDTRSDSLYKRKHVKGAIHLNFSDFTQQNLLRLIPNADTRILIYCNNNFVDDAANFASKTVIPVMVNKKIAAISLALNIPTYINLYGYGYRNVYELSELVSTLDKRITFEGTHVKNSAVNAQLIKAN